MRRTSHMPASVREEGVRVFVALPLSAQCKQVLEGVMYTMKPLAGEAWRFVPAQNLHITMRFLGEIPTEKVANALHACNESARSCPGLRLVLSSVGVFPQAHKPSVLWAGVAGDMGLLHSLATRLEAELVREGFPNEDKPLRPHITLARRKNIPGPAGVESLMAAGADLQTEWQCSELILYRSELRPQGPVYTVLGSVPLQPA